MDDNPYQDAARQRKAARLAVVLIATGADVDTVEAMSDDARRVLAVCAKVTRPSPATWEVVVDLLRLHRETVESYRALEATS